MNTYVDNTITAVPSTETVSVGIQNKNILKVLLPSRLATKNNEKNRIAIAQKTGEKALSVSPPARAPKPVAFCSLIPLKIDQRPGTDSVRNNAANPLKMPLT
jgi:hypothetical protein